MEFVIVSDYDKGDRIIRRGGRKGRIIDVQARRQGHSIFFSYLCEYDDASMPEWLEDYEIMDARDI